MLYKLQKNILNILLMQIILYYLLTEKSIIKLILNWSWKQWHIKLQAGLVMKTLVSDFLIQCILHLAIY